MKPVIIFVMMFLAGMPAWNALHFLVRQQLARHEMKEELEKRSLQTITLNKEEVRWTRQNKEVIIHGRLFDVKQWNMQGTRVVLNGLFDDAEEKLFEMTAEEEPEVESNVPDWTWENDRDNGIAFTTHFYQHNSIHAASLLLRPEAVFSPPPEA